MKNAWLITEKRKLHVINDSGAIAVIDTDTLDITCKVNCKLAIDDIRKLHDGILLVHNERPVYSMYSFNTSKVTRLCDAKDKKWNSVRSFGSPLHQVLPWNDGLIVHVGSTLLCCNASSRSVVPLMKDLHQSASVSLSKSRERLLVDNYDGVCIFHDAKSPAKQIPRACPGGQFVVSPDGKYFFETTVGNDGIQLIRVSDGVTIGQHALMLQVYVLSFSADSCFVMASAVDKRLYIYVVADPLEPSHTERLKALSSRQQPLLTDPLDIIADPRYKFIQGVTSFLEGSSSEPDFQQVLKDRQLSSSDEHTAPTEGEIKKPHANKKLTKRRSKNVQSWQSFMRNVDQLSTALNGVSEDVSKDMTQFQRITRHPTTLDIKYTGPCLQSSAKGRLGKLNEKDSKNDTNSGSCKSPYNVESKSKSRQIHFKSRKGSESNEN